MRRLVLPPCAPPSTPRVHARSMVVLAPLPHPTVRPQCPEVGHRFPQTQVGDARQGPRRPRVRAARPPPPPSAARARPCAALCSGASPRAAASCRRRARPVARVEACGNGAKWPRSNPATGTAARSAGWPRPRASTRVSATLCAISARRSSWTGTCTGARRHARAACSRAGRPPAPVCSCGR